MAAIPLPTGDDGLQRLADKEKQTLTPKETLIRHVTGLKLGLVVLSVTLVSFLILLDMSGISLAVLGQTLGGSFFLDFANLVFHSGLRTGLSKYAPTVDGQAVTEAGATAFRDLVPKENLSGVIRAYSLGVDHTLYLAAGAAVAMFVFGLGMGWQKIPTKKGTPAVPESNA